MAQQLALQAVYLALARKQLLAQPPGSALAVSGLHQPLALQRKGLQGGTPKLGVKVRAAQAAGQRQIGISAANYHLNVPSISWSRAIMKLRT